MGGEIDSVAQRPRGNGRRHNVRMTRRGPRSKIRRRQGEFARRS